MKEIEEAKHKDNIQEKKEKLANGKGIQKDIIVQEYFDYLFNQFVRDRLGDAKNATFKDEADVLIAYFKYIDAMQKITKIFDTVLVQLEITDKDNVCLLDKGFLDSSAYLKKALISPYANIEKEKVEPAITGSVLVNNGKVSLQTKRVVKLLTSDDYEYFMTYNPYTEEMLNKFTNIHNETDFSIAVGVFGHLDDKTYEEKMEMFSRFKRTLNRDYQVYECNTHDIYVAGVASIKKLNRRRK